MNIKNLSLVTLFVVIGVVGSSAIAQEFCDVLDEKIDACFAEKKKAKQRESEEMGKLLATPEGRALELCAIQGQCKNDKIFLEAIEVLKKTEQFQNGHKPAVEDFYSLDIFLSGLNGIKFYIDKKVPFRVAVNLGVREAAIGKEHINENQVFYFDQFNIDEQALIESAKDKLRDFINNAIKQDKWQQVEVSMPTYQ
jgi:hypothetical protein